MAKIMIIDDEKDFCEVLGHFLSRHGYEVLKETRAEKALERMSGSNLPDIILCDFQLKEMNGADVLEALDAKKIEVPVVIITAHENIKTAVDVMKMGAEDYLTKPIIPEELLGVIEALLEKYNNKLNKKASPEQSEAENEEKVEKQVESSEYIFEGSKCFKEILKQIDIVAPTDYSVIIYGESGSGKEAIAREIHKRSKRKDQAFMPIDCGVLTRELAGSELFGHEKGAFTGAVQQKHGSFEIANKGTVFLDEISNLSYDVQMSLLRVVQERKMRRVGGIADIELDVRIIIASNEKLWDASGGGSIREDLFHRFNEFVIHIPPLRERQDDIMIFANHFLRLANKELDKKVKGFSQEVEVVFQSYVWPGNLRELKNIVKRATLLCEGEEIQKDNIPYELIGSIEQGEGFLRGNKFSSSQPQEHKSKPVNLKTAGLDAEYELIMNTLRKVNFNKSKAAKLLHIDRKTLYYKINQYREIKGKKTDEDM